MARRNLWLIGLLLLQVGLIGARWASARENKEAVELGVLIPDVDVAKVRQLVVESGGQESTAVTLSKKEGAWRVEQAHGYPADGDHVEQALRDLSVLEIAHRVTSSASHHVDMKVADDVFERKVTMRFPDKSITVFIGESGHGGSVYARRKGEDAVYAVRDYSPWRLSSTVADWLDKGYFEVDGDRVVALEVRHGRSEREGVRLERLSAQRWRLASAPDAAIDKKSLNELLDQVQGIELSEVAGPAAAQSLPEPAVWLTVSLGDVQKDHEDGAQGGDRGSLDGADKRALGEEESPAGQAPLPASEHLALRIYNMGGDDYVMLREGSEYVVGVGKWRIEAVLSASRARLLGQTDG